MKRFAFVFSAILLFSISVCLLPTNASHLSTTAQRDSALNAIQLTQVASGLASPVFVTNAHDGSNRLFILERGGRIKIIQPGGLVTTFLDISYLVR